MINIKGLKSNIPTRGITRRIGLKSGSTILSMAVRIGLYGDIKYDMMAETITSRMMSCAVMSINRIMMMINLHLHVVPDAVL
jgi:hypothetical protein